MKYPKFKEAKYSTTSYPVRSRIKHNITVAFKYILITALFIFIYFICLCTIKTINPEATESISINIISIGASVVTFFSAIISILSLLDTICLKRYESNIRLLEKKNTQLLY